MSSFNYIYNEYTRNLKVYVNDTMLIYDDILDVELNEKEVYNLVEDIYHEFRENT